MNEYADVTRLFSAVALVLPRIAAAFLVLPVLSNDDMPTTARNSFFVSLALIVVPFALRSGPVEFTGVQWGLVIFREAFLGMCIGFAFSLVFWAIGNVGNLIDTKTGSTTAQIVDPLAGHQTSLTGAFLSRFAGWLFMVEVAFGLINRYAQQLNVFSLSSSVKVFVSAWIVLLSLGVMVQFVMDKLGAQRALLTLLQRVL